MNILIAHFFGLFCFFRYIYTFILMVRVNK
ncbi:Uncharacterised protein [Plesiomonas shigelloides]|nr:Uncharacterised protein [Plesiomonas shigelloides]